jgi:hypothetical protein
MVQSGLEAIIVKVAAMGEFVACLFPKLILKCNVLYRAGKKASGQEFIFYVARNAQTGIAILNVCERH